MPDSQPNYLTVKPSTGEVGAEFSGAIESRGINFPFPDPSQFSGFIPPEYTVNRIQWTNPVAYTGVNGYIEVSNGGVGNFMNLYHIAGTSGLNARTAQLRMRTFLAGVADPDRNEVQIEGIVQDAALGLFQRKKIIDAHNVSDFRLKAPSNFQQPTFYNPWANYSSPAYATQGYRVWNDGMCHVQGLIKSVGPAYATQYITAYIPTPVDGALVVPALGYVGGYGLVRLDITGIDANGAALIFGGSVFPEGSIFGFIGYSFSYQSTQIRN